MKNIDIKPNIYEKTIIALIKSYLIAFPNRIDCSEWNCIANSIGITYDLIQSFVENSSKTNQKNEHLPHAVIAENNDFESPYYELFSCLLNYYYICKSLKQIKIEDSKKSLNSNYELYQSISDNMCLMNINSGAYECICKKNFSQQFAPQSFKSFHPNDCLDKLDPYRLCNEFYSDNKEFLPLVYKIINYQLLTHANAMILIVIFQIMKYSPYIDNITKKIATEFYDSIHILLQDARVILVQPSYLYLDTSKEASQRGKKTDNTTRLHIVYGHDNYDTYSLLSLIHI